MADTGEDLKNYIEKRKHPPTESPQEQFNRLSLLIGKRDLEGFKEALKSCDATSIRNGRDNRSLLHTAAYYQFDDKDFIGPLLAGKGMEEKRAFLNAVDQHGKTALNYVIDNHEGSSDTRTDVIYTLLKEGADPNIQDSKGCAPLHAAVEDPACVASIFLLVRYGADLNIRDQDRRTPLHHTCFSYTTKSARMLLLLGADPTCEKNDGKTPHDMLDGISDVDELRKALSGMGDCKEDLVRYLEELKGKFFIQEIGTEIALRSSSSQQAASIAPSQSSILSALSGIFTRKKPEQDVAMPLPSLGELLIHSFAGQKNRNHELFRLVLLRCFNQPPARMPQQSALAITSSTDEKRPSESQNLVSRKLGGKN